MPDASCTAEIVWRLAKELGAELTPAIAEALYVGLVTDTGRFMYENTDAEAHRMAAELIEAGVEPHEVYRQLYEDLPFRRLELLAARARHVERYDDGAITLAHLTKRATTRRPAPTRPTRRASSTTCAPSRARRRRARPRAAAEDRDGLRKVSLRATDGRVDVSRIARALGGGGHPQAAGFTTACRIPSWWSRLARARARAARAQLGRW